MRNFTNWFRQWRNYFQIDLLAYITMILIFIFALIFIL